MPVQKARSPVAVRIATHDSSSASKSAKTASSAASISFVNEFMASGRSIVTMAMWSWIS